MVNSGVLQNYYGPRYLVTSRDDDCDELAAIARGDAEAFDRVYKLYRDRVYGFAYRMLGSRVAAEDVTHEAFLVLIQHPTRYKAERGSVLTFLCAVARNHILKYFRRRGADALPEDAERAFEGAEGREPDPLSTLMDRELEAKVNQSVAALPIEQREVLVLREFEDLSYEEIAAVTGLSLSVVKVRLHRGRQALAKSLAPYMTGGEGGSHELRRS